ncbi:hypothetical protein CVT24_001128 [Panaeolus cyanescens]|uniref:Phytocyanin domain-containing protein n=1 Tax=Panaeolus cyanescens TaxID=181874 RepID=A0A409YZ95_9AGAR|nr:hypothetical protein CVT24_001128 [Panaeolus cyanescens]
MILDCTFLKSTLALVIILGLGEHSFAAIREPVQHTVNVGLQGSFFDPPTTNATVNDTITFVFWGEQASYTRAHSVTQSSSRKPCAPLKGGFNSGIIGVGSSLSQPIPSWTLVVSEAQEPIYFFCSVNKPPSLSHCNSGMVGAINVSPNQYKVHFSAALKDTYTPRHSKSVDVVLAGVGAFATASPGVVTTTSSSSPTHVEASPTLSLTYSTSMAAPTLAPHGAHLRRFNHLEEVQTSSGLDGRFIGISYQAQGLPLSDGLQSAADLDDSEIPPMRIVPIRLGHDQPSVSYNTHLMSQSSISLAEPVTETMENPFMAPHELLDYDHNNLEAPVTRAQPPFPTLQNDSQEIRLSTTSTEISTLPSYRSQALTWLPIDTTVSPGSVTLPPSYRTSIISNELEVPRPVHPQPPNTES